MNRNILELKRPASVDRNIWKTGLPIGNGITGALIPGAISEEQIIVTRHDLWHARKNYSEVPDVSSDFAEMRVLIDDGNYQSACKYLTNALSKKGFPSFAEPTPFPLGAIILNYVQDGIFFKHYRRGVNMQKGFSYVKWEDDFGSHLRRSFVSREDGILYINITSEKSCTYSLDFDAYDNFDSASKQERESRQSNLKKAFSDNSLFYSANTDGQDFGVHILVEINDNGRSESNGSEIKITSSDFTIKLLSFAKVDVGTNAFASSPDFDQALIAHSALHSAIYDGVSIELAADDDKHLALSNEELLDEAYEDTASVALYEKLWRFGRYLFISSYSKESNPFPLYGLWAGAYNLPWNCHVCNENVEMIYWHVLSGGLAESLKNLIDYYFEKLPDCKINAQRLFGCRGIYVPVYTTPETMDGRNLTPPTPTVPITLNWISGAGWLSLHFYQYFIYTKDAETLNSKIIPFMVEAARFYRDYIRYGENREMRIYPSVSPENIPIGHPGHETENATMDFAIMKGLFSHLFELLSLPESTCEVDSSELEAWKEIESNIPPYMTNDDGSAKEWMHKDLIDNHDHRHFSHIFPLFPGDEISLASHKELLSPFRKAAELRLIKSQSGWSFAHLASIRAKLGQGDKALSSLATMAKSCLLDNFFTLHNDWRHMGASMVIDFMTPIQLDALMGSVNVIQDMIFQYGNNSLIILPALPAQFEHVSARGLRFPDGTVSVHLENGAVEVEVTADSDCSLPLIFKHNKIMLDLVAGEKKSIHFS